MWNPTPFVSEGEDLLLLFWSLLIKEAMLGGKDDWDCFYASSDLKVLAYFDAFDKYVGMWTENAPLKGTVKIPPSWKNFGRVSYQMRAFTLAYL